MITIEHLTSVLTTVATMYDNIGADEQAQAIRNLRDDETILPNFTALLYGEALARPSFVVIYGLGDPEMIAAVRVTDHETGLAPYHLAGVLGLPEGARLIAAVELDADPSVADLTTGHPMHMDTFDVKPEVTSE